MSQDKPHRDQRPGRPKQSKPPRPKRADRRTSSRPGQSDGRRSFKAPQTPRQIAAKPGVAQRAGAFFAQTAQGLEELCAQELTRLGMRDVKPRFMGCTFETDPAGLYRVNYQSRLASRILLPVARFACMDERDLYAEIAKVDWPGSFSEDKTFAVTALGHHPRIKHSRFAALRVKDAVVDAFREKTGRRPSVDVRDPDIHLVLHLEPSRAALYWDTSGAPLHRRGYRQQPVEAPIQETVAAAFLALTPWDRHTPLVDPFCGSGTILAEALMLAGQIPAGYLRKRWGFEILPDFDRDLWRKVKQEADRQIRAVPEGLIRGSDNDRAAVKAARVNLGTLPGGEKIPVALADYTELEGLEGQILIANPPYGMRLKPDEMTAWVRRLGDFLKTRCQGGTAVLYFGDRQLIKSVGLRPTFKKPLPSGGLDGRLVRYDLVQGRWDDRQRNPKT